jgi:hypothetical protein
MTTTRNIAPPNLPTPPIEYERRYLDQLNNVHRLFFTQLTNFVNAPLPHGSIYDTTTQVNPVSNAVNLVTYNSTGSTYGVTVASPTSRVIVAETAVYNIQFSLQLDKSGGGATTVYIWLRVNGQDVAHSASKVVIDGPNAELVAAWNFMQALREGDYFEIAWSSPDTTVVILAQPAASPVPEIPSAILTVAWVSGVNI